MLNGVSQTIAVGPVGFMEAIKQLGTNGGGFFNTNSAHPFENPTGLTNLLSIILLLSIPVALTYVFGKMVGAVRQGVALLAAMAIIFGCWVGFAVAAEHQANPAVQAAGLTHQPTGNTEGKEVRFGVPSHRTLRRVVHPDLDRFGRQPPTTRSRRSAGEPCSPA